MGFIAQRIFRVPHGISVQRVERAATARWSAESSAFPKLLQLKSGAGKTISISGARMGCARDRSQHYRAQQSEFGGEQYRCAKLFDIRGRTAARIYGAAA